MLQELLELGTIIWIFLEASLDDAFHLATPYLFHVDLGSEDLLYDFGHGVRVEWELQCMQLVQYYPDGPHIHFHFIVFLLEYLWCHVGWSANARDSS